MPKSKAQAIGESIAHVLGLGVLAGAILGPMALGLIYVREFASKDGLWRWLPWPYKPQWPPGDVVTIKELSPGTVHVIDGAHPMLGSLYTELDRGADMRRDLIEMTSGWVVGQAIQIGVVLWLLR